MPQITISLPDPIQKLKDRRNELENLEIDPQGPTADDQTKQRFKIRIRITEISNKIHIFNLIAAHRRAASVVVERPTEEEINALGTALEKLDKVISREQTFEETLQTFAVIISAANEIQTAVS